MFLRISGGHRSSSSEGNHSTPTWKLYSMEHEDKVASVKQVPLGTIKYNGREHKKELTRWLQILSVFATSSVHIPGSGRRGRDGDCTHDLAPMRTEFQGIETYVFDDLNPFSWRLLVTKGSLHFQDRYPFPIISSQEKISRVGLVRELLVTSAQHPAVHCSSKWKAQYQCFKSHQN